MCMQQREDNGASSKSTPRGAIVLVERQSDVAVTLLKALDSVPELHVAQNMSLPGDQGHAKQNRHGACSLSDTQR